MSPMGKIEGPMKVLFCGKHFPWAMRLTREELEGHPGIECSDCDPSELEERIADAHLVLPFMLKIDEGIISKGNHLRCVLQYGVGLDGVDISACTRRQIYVSNIPSAECGNAEATAEHAMYLMLSALRQPARAQATLEARKLGEPLVKQVFGRHVLLIGFGNVGSKLFQMLLPFLPSRITAVKRSPWAKETAEHLAQRAAVADVSLSCGTSHDMASCIPANGAKADIVLVVCPLTEETRGMVDSSFISSFLNRSAVVVNVARGHVVDRQAILSALDSGHLSFFCSDVGCSPALPAAATGPAEPILPADPLAQHPQTLFTPHNGGVADVSYRNMARITAEVAKRIQAGEPPAVWINGDGSGNFNTR